MVSTSSAPLVKRNESRESNHIESSLTILQCSFQRRMPDRPVSHSEEVTANCFILNHNRAVSSCIMPSPPFSVNQIPPIVSKAATFAPRQPNVQNRVQ